MKNEMKKAACICLKDANQTVELKANGAHPLHYNSLITAAFLRAELQYQEIILQSGVLQTQTNEPHY